MNQDTESLLSGWGKRREIYGYDAASQEERGAPDRSFRLKE
jgi:hypothetical protein